MQVNGFNINDTLARVSDFIAGPNFRRIVGAIIALLALAILAAWFLVDWLNVPASDGIIEHQPHYAATDIRLREPTEGVRIEFTPARNSDILLADTILAIGEYQLDPAEMGPDGGVLAYRRAVNDALRAGEDEVQFTVSRYGETLSFPMDIPDGYPEESPLALNIPVDARPQDAGVTIEYRDVQLENPAGVSLTPAQIWLGSSDELGTLSVESLVKDEGGFWAVRFIDRLLVLIPLAALLLLYMAYRYAVLRVISGRRALGYLALLGIFLFIFPLLWQVLSTNTWRSYITAQGDEIVNYYAIPDEIVETFNIDKYIIKEEVTEDFRDDQVATSITDAWLDEMTEAYTVEGLPTGLGFAVFLVAGVALFLVTLEQYHILRNRDRLTAVVMISPSIILLAIFVYAFIAQTVQYSAINWGTNNARPALAADVETTYVGLQNYENLMTDLTEGPFRTSLVNTFFFTIFFLLACVVLGFLLALLLDQKVRGEGIFRTIFLFPMALSFVVTGTVWRWLLQPRGGVNVLPEMLAGLDPLELRWTSSTAKSFQFQWPEVPLMLTIFTSVVVAFVVYRLVQARRLKALGDSEGAAWVFWAVFAGIWLLYFADFWQSTIWPPLDDPTIDEIRGGYGFNAALSGIIVAAVWQMSGYTMALFLAGMRAIPEELREAARVDGCNEFQVYRYIVIPQLRPVTLTALIILGHISLKIFDLVFAMAGPDNSNTIVPGILLYTEAFRGNNLSNGSAIAVVMLLLVSVVIIPYLWSTLREERNK